VGSLGGPFALVLVLALLGFGLESVVRAVIPLMVLERGGDAVWVGAVAAAAALPSVVFRPLIGRLIDTRDHARFLRIGAAVTAFGPVLLLIPGLATLGLMRFAHGTGWATYSVANHVLMAKLAPPDRRGEASGYFMAMPAIATLVGPPLGVALYVGLGEVPPIAVALGLGTVAFALSLRIRIPAIGSVRRDGGGSAAGTGRFLERTAIPATLMVTTFMAGHSLFLVFPPVYLAAVGEAPDVLPAYFLAYGLVMTVSQLLAGGVSDRLGRVVSIRIGCAIALGGFASALALEGLAALIAAGLAYATGMSLVLPTLSALTIDRAPAGRLGAASATYSLGYQLATGVSGIVWGVVIATVGFPWPFGLAMVLLLATIALSFRIAST
jgi:MFS family permease